MYEYAEVRGSRAAKPIMLDQCSRSACEGEGGSKIKGWELPEINLRSGASAHANNCRVIELADIVLTPVRKLQILQAAGRGQLCR